MHLRLTTPADLHLPYYSHSIVEAINTCPRWGIIRYIERRYFASQYRAMALEAGSAMHDVFAAFNLTQLAYVQSRPDLAEREADRIFSKIDESGTLTVAPWRGVIRFDLKRDSLRDIFLENCFKTLHHLSDFYDDPDDRIRTIANMESTTIRFVDEQLPLIDRSSVYISDDDSLVGIEIAFDMVVDDRLRFIGTIDRISRRSDNRIRNREYKTASRLDEAFRRAFMVKSQPTGYILATQLLTGEPCTESDIIGIKIKQTRSHEDYLSFTEAREDHHFRQWYRTLIFTHELVESYRGRALEAPQFTHSCNRYFRPCGFVDLCAADEDDAEMIYEAMEVTPLSPSEENTKKQWELQIGREIINAGNRYEIRD